MFALSGENYGSVFPSIKFRQKQKYSISQLFHSQRKKVPVMSQSKLKKKLNLYKQEFKLLFVSVTALPFSRGELSTGPGKAACSPTLLVSHWSYPTYFFHCLNHLESTRYLNTKILCMSILFTSKILYIIILYKS